MDTLSTRLLQSQNKIGRILSELPELLKDRQLQDAVDVYQKKVQGHMASCENRLKQQHKANVTNKQHLKQKESEAELLQVKKEAEEKLIASLQEELNHLENEQSKFKQGPALGTSEEKVRQLNAEEALFKLSIATEIEKVQGGWLQVVFTQIDPGKPNSKFFFLFKLDEERRYIVGDCQPPIQDMDMLLRKLNSTNNLSKFVHSVRKRFKQSVQS